MLKKPDACRGCPLYQDGEGGFVPDRVRGSLVIMAQNPGQNETGGVWWSMGGRIRQGPVEPLIGASGWMVRNQLIPLADVEEEDVTYANAVRCRWRGTDKLPPLHTKVAQDAIHHCQRAHGGHLRDGQTFVALGEYALWYLTGIRTLKGRERGETDTTQRKSALESWRGWTLPRHSWDGPVPRPTSVWHPVAPRVFPTYHPAAAFRSPALGPLIRADFAKLGRLLRGEWPAPFLRIGHEVPPPTGLVAYDTEYHYPSLELRHWSWSTGDRTGVVHGPVTAMEHPIFHNAPADWRYLPAPPAEWDDTMYMDAALHAGEPHDLNHLGSLYARTNRWKHLSESNPEQYSGGDALGTWDVYHALRRQLDSDAGADRVYTDALRPLIPVIVRRRPTLLHRPRVSDAVKAMKAEQARLKVEAQAMAGWPLNLASPPQVAAELKAVDA